MVIYSEKTKERYDTVQECIAAETEYDRKQAKIAEEKKKIEMEKENRVKEITQACQAVKDADENYRKLVNEFVKDYGEEAFLQNGGKVTLGVNPQVISFDEAVCRLFGIPFNLNP